MKKTFTLLYLLTIITISCSKGDSAPDEQPVVLSELNFITSFKLMINGQLQDGQINQNNTITFAVVGANLSSLAPLVEYSAKARLSPSENDRQNFNNEVVYTVFAENGDSNIYRVIVDNRPLSSENKILSFAVVINNETIDADIDQESKMITFNSGEFDITALTPTITVSEYATISPISGSPQNFENIVTYTVTAENGEPAEYKVISNPPQINNFSYSPALFYTGAEIYANGYYLNPNSSGAKLYLTDGTNDYPLEILDYTSFSTDPFYIEYSLHSQIPENIPTYANYKLVFETTDTKSESGSYIDVLAENAPNPISLNQDLYQWNDVLIIYGENLPDTISIPSNGSNYIIRNSNGYDLTVNPDRTQLSVTLEYYGLFPSYYGRDPEQKTITMLGPNNRAGKSIIANFK